MPDLSEARLPLHIHLKDKYVCITQICIYHKGWVILESARARKNRWCVDLSKGVVMRLKIWNLFKKRQFKGADLKYRLFKFNLDLLKSDWTTGLIISVYQKAQILETHQKHKKHLQKNRQFGVECWATQLLCCFLVSVYFSFVHGITNIHYFWFKMNSSLDGGGIW